MTSEPKAPPRPRRRMKRKVAAIAAGLLSVSSAAGASVLVNNYMSADFAAGTPPCMIKVAGADEAFEVSPGTPAFDFELLTTEVDGVDLTRENISITGLTGDAVRATEVYEIQNNCENDLDITLVDGNQGTFTEKRLEVYLGTPTGTTGYPGVTGSTGWDGTPLIFAETAADQVFTSGTVNVPAGTSVDVGMVVLTGDAATGSDQATWTVQAEWS